MRDRYEQLLRGACFVLAVLVLLSVLRAGCRAGALWGAKIPAVPTLETNSVATTNAPSASTATNSLPSKIAVTNAVKPSALVSNLVTLTAVATDPPGTNILSRGTNLPVTNLLAIVGTNGLVATATNLASTNKPAKKPGRNMPPDLAAMGGMNFGGMPGMPGKAAKLPAAIQTRVDKIVESEMFAPVMHPQPMALLGIAGETVFLRTASGQTGLLKADAPLEGVKLLRIGINRVLVEVDGQKKELTIFDGNGSESLLESTK